MDGSNDDTQSAYRLLPAVDEVVRDPRAQDAAARAPRELLVEVAARTIDAWRDEIRGGRLGATELARRIDAGAIFQQMDEALRRLARRGVVPCVNATGVVLNTGLGRAPVHPEVAERMAAVARGYCVLEVDRETNERNQRDDHLADQLRRLVGAEAAIGVNNCAAAVFLVFQTFAGGREAVVSRGELVEIGGSFRVPDVMARANAKLVEVGTTNRTRLADYAAALNERTGLLMKVHTSNFRVVGFTEEVAPRELAELGRARGIVTGFDLGSGLVETAGAEPLQPLLGDEPLLREAVASGVDVVCFSGDKLLGAPQAGLVVGRKAAIAALRKNPIYRALRLDKVTLAGVEATLDLLLAGRGDEIPTRRMLARAQDTLESEARGLAARLAALPGVDARVVEDRSQPGSGAAPDVYLPTFVVSVALAGRSAAATARDLRRGEPPVFTRIADERVLLDPRTLLAGDPERLITAFERAAGRTSGAERPGRS